MFCITVCHLMSETIIISVVIIFDVIFPNLSVNFTNVENIEISGNLWVFSVIYIKL